MMTDNEETALASRILNELGRKDAKNNHDAHFICRLMTNIVEILSSESNYPKQTNHLLSKSEFSLRCLKSERFLSLASSHIGGELDGWGAASTLVFTSIQALTLMFSTTTPVEGQSKAAFLFFVEASRNDQSEASKVLYRLLTIASSCPSALVQQMSSGGDNNNNNSSSFTLQVEGEIFAWKCAWECMTSLCLAVGLKETRKFMQKRSEDIARAKALRQGAAVFVAYLKNMMRDDANYKMMLSVAKDFVENHQS